MSHELRASPSAVRVLWLIKGLGPGGAESLLVSTARAVDHARFHIEVGYVRSDKDQLALELEALGVATHVLGENGPRSWPGGLRQLLLAGDFDVVHAHAPLLAGVGRLVVRSLPRDRRPFVLYTEHNEWGSYGPPTRMLNAITARLDDHRWAVSRRVRNSMWSAISRDSEVLVQGIEFERFLPTLDARERIRKELGIPAGAVVACTVANLRRPKDYPNFLRACRLAIEDVPDLCVLAVGQGPMKDEIDRLHTELDLGHRVRMLGFRSDVPDVLAASDMFIVASAHEGGPLSLIEAMSIGLPSVATNVGFVSDAIRNGVEGVIVPSGDAEALAGAMVTLARDKAMRHSMAVAAREASGKFDIRRAVARQCEVYQELALRRHARTSTP